MAYGIKSFLRGGRNAGRGDNPHHLARDNSGNPRMMNFRDDPEGQMTVNQMTGGYNSGPNNTGHPGYLEEHWDLPDEGAKAYNKWVRKTYGSPDNSWDTPEQRSNKQKNLEQGKQSAAMFSEQERERRSKAGDSI